MNVDNAPIREIDTIFRDPYVGIDLRNAQRNYTREAKDFLVISCIVNSGLYGAKMI